VFFANRFDFIQIKQRGQMSKTNYPKSSCFYSSAFVRENKLKKNRDYFYQKPIFLNFHRTFGYQILLFCQ
jgi:hypothetical protein